MKTWVEAARLLLARWNWWLVVACLLLGAGGFTALWLRAPLESGLDLTLLAGYTLFALGFLAQGLYLARLRFAPQGVRLAHALQHAELWGAVALFAAVSVWLPWRLVTWVPRFETLAAQAWSAGVRFLLAWALLTGGLCWLVACLGLLSRESRNAEAVPAQ